MCFFRAFAAGQILVVLFFSFLIYSYALPERVCQQKFIFSHITEIASDGTYIYTLDTDFNNICKYDETGALIYRIHYAADGYSYIFCNEAGALCRYDVRAKSITTYDSNGTAIETVPVGELSLSTVRELSVGDTTYALQRYIFRKTVVTVKREGATFTFLVETFIQHLLLLFVILLYVAILGIMLYNIVQFCLLEYYEKHPEKCPKKTTTKSEWWK